MDFGDLENKNNVYNMLLEKIVSYENIITDTFIIINDYKKIRKTQVLIGKYWKIW